MCCWYKNRHINQQNRVPQNKPTYLCQLIFDKGGKNIQLSKDNLFSKLCWENRTAACKSVKLEYSLTPYTKINSERLKDSNIRCFCCCLALSCGQLFCSPMSCQPARLLCPWESPGRHTGVGCHFLLQGIFPTQGSNLHLLLGRWILYHWSTWKTYT